VEIDYDVLGKQIGVLFLTRTNATAKVANMTVNTAASAGLSKVEGGPHTGGCDVNSPFGSCDQLHSITFSDELCSASNAELVLSVEFECADGSDPSACGHGGVVEFASELKCLHSFDKTSEA
jgi:hypothetical protein